MLGSSVNGALYQIIGVFEAHRKQIDRAFYFTALTFLSVLLILPLWQVTYLPLGDLPDHAAQIQMILNYEQYQDDYRIQWFTPYLVGYALTLLFASFLPITVAIKLVLSICLLAMPLTIAWLIRVLNGNKYWLLIIFPTCYSYAFYWGFLSYTVATPVAFFCMALTAYLAQQTPTIRHNIGLFAASILLFFSHALAWLMIACLVPLIFWQYTHLKDAVKRSIPFYLAVPIVAFWLSKGGDAGHGPQAGHYIEHYIGKVLQHFNYFLDQIAERTEKSEHLPRAREMFSLMIGRPSSLDYLFLSLALLAWPFFIGAKLKRSIKCWLPFLTVATAYMLVPYWIFETAYVYLRFAVFLFPAYLFVLRPKTEATTEQLPAPTDTQAKPPYFKWAMIAAGPTIVVSMLLSNIQTFREFKQNDTDFSSMLSKMEPGKTALSLTFDHEAPFRFSAAYLHFGSWCQAEKGGLTLMNFTFDRGAANVPVRYKSNPWAIPDVWQPKTFNWYRHQGDRYDYFVVRSAKDQSAIFGHAKNKVELVANEGKWWLYKKTGEDRVSTTP